MIDTIPLMPDLQDKLILDDLSVDEVEPGELQPFEMEDVNERPDEIEYDPNNLPDVHTFIQ